MGSILPTSCPHFNPCFDRMGLTELVWAHLCISVARNAAPECRLRRCADEISAVRGVGFRNFIARLRSRIRSPRTNLLHPLPMHSNEIFCRSPAFPEPAVGILWAILHRIWLPILKKLGHSTPPLFVDLREKHHGPIPLYCQK